MDNRITELRKLLDEAHRVMEIQVLGLRRLKSERDSAEALVSRAAKSLLPVIGGIEDTEVLSLYGALTDHITKIMERAVGDSETTKRFDPNRYQAIDVSAIRAEVERRRVAFCRRWILAFLIAAVIGTLALFAAFCKCGKS